MKTTIAKKIAFPFFVILVLLIGMIGITYQGFKKVSATLDTMELESVKRGAAGNLRFNITQLLMASNDYITTQKQYYQREFDRLNLVVDNFYDEFNRLSLTDEEQRLSLLIKQDLDSIRAYSAQIFSIPNPRQSPQTWALMETMDYRFGEEVNKKTTQIFDGISKRVEEYRIQAADVKENAMKLIFGGTFLGIFISIGVSFFTVRRISKPIIMVAKAAESIANGDYSHHVIIKSHDEVAFLGKSFNVMAESIQRSQKALKESKRLTEVIVSTVPIGLFVFDENGKILSVNNAFCKNFGLEQNLLLGQNIISMFEKVKAPEECRNHILSHKPMSDIECNYSDTVKGARIINLTICPIPLTEGESLLVVEDITKRKHDEQIVINSEKYFRALIENSTDALGVISPEGYLLYEGKSNKSITGYEHNELLHQNVIKVIHPDDVAAVNELLKNILENPQIIASLEIRFLQKEGTWRWLETKWKNALNEPSVGGIIINANDITERRNAKAVIEKQAEQLEAILATTSDGFWVVDQFGQICEVNDAYCKMSGYSRDEILYLKISDLDVNETSDDVANHIKKVIENGSDIFEAIHKAKDGVLFFVEVVAIYNPKRKQILAFFRDITERKKLEASILQQLKFTNALNEISSLIISSEEKNVILQKTSDVLGEILNVDRCLIYKISFEERKAIALSEWLNPSHSDIDPTKGTYPLELFIGGATQMLKTKQWLESHVNNINPHFGEDGSGEILHQQMKIKSLLWYPFSFFADDYHLFVLNTIQRSREWTKEEIDFLESVSKQISMALEKIRLLDEKAKADKLLIEQSNILRNVLDNSPIGIWMLNETGRMKFVNKTFCNAVGIPEEKFLSVHHYAELYDETTANNCMHSDTEAFALDQPYTSIERVKFVDGQLHDLEIIKKKVTDKEGNILGLIGISMDVTERKRAEEALRHSEERYRTLYEDNPTMYFTVDPAGTVLSVNQYGCEQLGFTAHELVGQSVLNVFHDEDKESALQCVAHCVENLGQVFHWELRKVCQTGSVMWVKESARAIQETDGQIVIYLVCENINERKRAEEELVKIKTVVEQTADCVVITDKNGRIQYVNQAFTTETGYSREEAVGKNSRISKSGRHSKEFYESLWKTILSGEVFRATFMNKRKDGELIYVSNTITPIKDNMGNITHFVSTAKNITEQYYAQQEIISQKNKFAQLFNNSPIAIALLDAQDRLTVINESFSALFGYYIEEIEGKSLNDLIVPDEFKKEAEAYSFETMGGNQVNKESYRKKKDGSLAYVQIVGVPVIVNDITIGFYGMYVDLTHIKKAEEELTKAKEKAEEMSRLKSNFLANMSHELRTPLNGILGYASILTSSLEDQEFSEMAQTIHTSGKRLSETLNLILDLSKAETEKLEVVGKIVDVASMVKSIINSFSADAESKNLVLESVTNAGEAHALLDENLFERAVGNLIGNAIKFTEKGKITVEVGKELYERENWIYIKVKDTGIGIPEDKINLIWEEFRQASEGLARHFEGTGLGLTISKRIIEIMKGKVTVESKVGVGSIFTVMFPSSEYTLQYDEALSTKTPPTQKPKETGSKILVPKIVLYVEDDLINQNVVQLYLKNVCKVETARDGQTALQMAAETQYDLVLMDINLGLGMDGLAVTKELRKMPRYAETPIVAVTAYAMESDKKEFLAGGCSHYLSKPFDKEELRDLVTSIVISEEMA